MNPSIYIVKEIVSIGLCHFVFPRFGNRDSFPVFHEEVPVFQRFNVIHIDQAIPVTPQKLGIGFQHGREIGKRHIGTYYAGSGMDLNIVIGIICIYNIINQDSGLIPSFLDLDVVDEFLGGFFKTLHRVRELIVSIGFYQVIQSAHAECFQGVFLAGGGEDNLASGKRSADLLGKSDACFNKESL